jgi:ArsR family transcriptional regulator
MSPVSFFKALAEDTRLQCLLLIQQETELCVCELMEALRESQPKISRHLANLRSSGLLQDRRQGQWVFYQLSPDLPDWCTQVLADTRLANEKFLRASMQRLAAMGTRPERRRNACC